MDDHVVVRLRGVDAPELHYRPFAPHALLKQRAGTFSQPFGASAARALRSFVERTCRGTIVPCVVRTTVGAPEQAFDPYGRLVGDLVIRAKHGPEINVNRWLVRSGWAFPALYASMSKGDIICLSSLARRAREAHVGAWHAFTSAVTNVRFTTAHEPEALEERGHKVVLPLLFRRACAWHVSREEGRASSCVAALRACRERCWRVEDFLDRGTAAPSFELGSFVSRSGVLTIAPERLVFADRASTLVRAVRRAA